MPLNRTAFNALVDGTTKWNKTQIKDVILDPVDAEFNNVVPSNAPWIVVPFNATDFNGNSMTWTVVAANVKRFAYIIVGKTMTIAVWIQDTTLAGTSTGVLTIKIPGGKVAAGLALDMACIKAFDTVGVVNVPAVGTTTMSISPLGSNTFGPMTGNCAVLFTFTFEIQ